MESPHFFRQCVLVYIGLKWIESDRIYELSEQIEAVKANDVNSTENRFMSK